MVFSKAPDRVDGALPAAGPVLAPKSAPEESPVERGPRLDGVRLVMINWRDPWQTTAGGAEEYAWRISRHLAELGAIVTFLTKIGRAHV